MTTPIYFLNAHVLNAPYLFINYVTPTRKLLREKIRAYCMCPIVCQERHLGELKCPRGMLEMLFIIDTFTILIERQKHFKCVYWKNIQRTIGKDFVFFITLQKLTLLCQLWHKKSFLVEYTKNKSQFLNFARYSVLTMK